jgi:large conductance mechanosensitive channel
LRIMTQVADKAKGIGGQGLHVGSNSLDGFKKFLLRGNVIDLAVGIVVGAAFNTVVQAFVGDMITPLIGIFGGFNFPGWNLTIRSSNFQIGAFLNSLVSFLIIAAVVYFFVVKPFSAMQDHLVPTEKPDVKECPFCFNTIVSKATRCGYCTSQLPSPGTAEAVGVTGETVTITSAQMA